MSDEACDSMSKYFQAAQRSNSRVIAAPLNDLTPPSAAPDRGRLTVMAPEPGSGLVGHLARNPALRRLGEQLAALSVVDAPVRVLVSGCRAGDGASTIAAALAIDLSQRLAARTVLIECHLHHPTPKSLVTRTERDTGDLVGGNQIAQHSSAWPRLDTVTYALPPEAPFAPHSDNIGKLLNPYQVAVVDVGVVRLDAQMLTIARPKDPVLIVTRYRHTERQELTSTVNTIRVTERRIAGVVLNGYNSPVPAFIRRLLGFGG
jgi:Mrp family chromosome partitioning ATPase